MQVLLGFIESESYGDLSDYLDGVTEVWGASVRADIEREVSIRTSQLTDESDLDFERARQGAARKGTPLGVLLKMPETDFLTATEAAARVMQDPFVVSALVGSVNKILVRRGAPYRAEGVGRGMRLTWTGDAVVEEQVLRPALAALDDPRVARGPG